MVRAKKFLGQHFLKDKHIARKIVSALQCKHYRTVIEVGPGTGALTGYLLERHCDLILIEKDREACTYLSHRYDKEPLRLVCGDFLQADLPRLTEGRETGIIGNFPYNISSQIIFKILENRDLIPEMVGMFQKEVAERLAAHPGTKSYGILSVLTQLYYDVRILFTVSEKVFVPPPKVKSAVVRLQRKENPPQVDFQKLKALVKKVFNQRRKTLRNSLKNANLAVENIPRSFLDKRPEVLAPDEFLLLYDWIYSK